MADRDYATFLSPEEKPTVDRRVIDLKTKGHSALNSTGM